MDLLAGTLLAAIATIAVLALPGLPLALALRMRGLVLCAVLPVLSLAVIALSAEVGHELRADWSLLVPLALGILLAGVVLGARELHRRRARHRPRHLGAAGRPALPLLPTGREGLRAVLVPVAGLLLGGGSLLVLQLRRMGSVDAVSQTFDNVFHLSAVRHVMRLHDASVGVVGGMTRLPGESGYYPALWHQAASLVAQLSGQDVALASNVLMLAAGCVVWPLGMMALVGSATSGGRAAVGLAGALAGISGAFPLELMSWGLLLPYLLSIVLLPTLLLGAAHLLALSPAARRLDPAQLAAILIASLLAVTLAHPQGALAAIVLGLPMALVAVGMRVRSLRRGDTDSPAGLAATAGLALLALAAGLVGWSIARPSRGASSWDPTAHPGEAVRQVLSLAPNSSQAFLPLALILLAAVLAVALRSRSRWLLVPWLVAAGADVLIRSLPEGDLRYLLTGPFYSDNHRVSALTVLLAVPLLAVGLEAIGRELRDRATARGAAPSVLTAIGALGALVAPLVLGVSWASPATGQAERGALPQWQGQQLLSPDERALLTEVPGIVPPDAVVATNPWNGGSLVYALADREVTSLYMTEEVPRDTTLLHDRLDEARHDPRVCDAMHEEGVEYALDFGPEELWDRRDTMSGMKDLSSSGVGVVVAQEGDAKLLRLLPCRGTDGSMSS